MPISSLPPTKLMAGLWVEALRRVQGLGLVPEGLGSWDNLFATVALLPDSVLAEYLPDYPWRGLPSVWRPSLQLREAVMPHLWRSAQAGGLGTASSLLPPASAYAGPSPKRRVAALAPSQQRPRHTPHRTAFNDTVACVPPSAAVASLRDARTAAST